MERRKIKALLLAVCLGLVNSIGTASETLNYVDYVNPLVGTQSTFELSAGRALRFSIFFYCILLW